MWPDVLEAIIGTVFVLAASGSILILSSDPHGGESLKELLTGQILWVDYKQLIPAAIISVIILLFWYHPRSMRNATLSETKESAKESNVIKDRHPLLFYLLFALAVTVSVQLIGLYLVFASLIIPALSVKRLIKWALPIAFLIGFIGYTVGLLTSTILDLPSGATIVWSLALSGLLVKFCYSCKK